MSSAILANCRLAEQSTIDEARQNSSLLETLRADDAVRLHGQVSMETNRVYGMLTRIKDALL